MKKNVGNLDKLIRLILAVIIFLFVYKNDNKETTTLQIVLLVIAFIFALTSLLNYCPIYSIFGIDTNKKRQN